MSGLKKRLDMVPNKKSEWSSGEGLYQGNQTILFRLQLPWSVMPLLPERDAAQPSSKLSNQRFWCPIKAHGKSFFLQHPEDASTARAGHQLPTWRETMQERHCHSVMRVSCFLWMTRPLKSKMWKRKSHGMTSQKKCVDSQWNVYQQIHNWVTCEPGMISFNCVAE